MIRIIKNKQESKDFIQEKGFNTFPEIHIHKDDKTKLLKFLKIYQSPLYVLRDGLRPQSKYYFFKTFEECVNLLVEYEDMVIIAVSVNAYKDHKVILGTIELSKENMISITASMTPDSDHRSIFHDSDFNYFCSIYDKCLNNIPKFDLLYGFLVENNLVDVIVEFTIYDIPVGIRNELIVIQEVRNY